MVLVRHRAAVGRARGAVGVEAEILRSAQRRLRHVADRLAGVGGFDQRDFFRTRFNRVGDGVQDRAALVAGNGALALLKRHGAQVAARRLIAPLYLKTAVEGVTVATGERLFGDVTLLDVVESDVRGLEASLTRV